MKREGGDAKARLNADFKALVKQKNLSYYTSLDFFGLFNGQTRDNWNWLEPI